LLAMRIPPTSATKTRTYLRNNCPCLFLIASGAGARIDPPRSAFVVQRTLRPLPSLPCAIGPGVASPLGGKEPACVCHDACSCSAVAQQAAKRATATIPIVMLLSSDPVDAGLIESLARPGTNVTGMAILTSLVTVKQLELLNEAFPQAMRVAVLADDIPSGQRLLVAAESAARSLRIGLIPLPLRDEADLPGLLELAT